MAILTPQQKRLRIFAYIFFATLVITGLILYFGFLRKPASPASPAASTSPIYSETFLRLQRLDINWEFLESDLVEQLEFFGEHPVQPGDAGRENPFLPI